jgi:hypothetical protein
MKIPVQPLRVMNGGHEKSVQSANSADPCDAVRALASQPPGEKAEKAIRVIKGFRKQGSVLDVVIVAKTITVQMVPVEPRMADLPSWLDPNNQDDRIIEASSRFSAISPPLLQYSLPTI